MLKHNIYHGSTYLDFLDNCAKNLCENGLWDKINVRCKNENVVKGGTLRPGLKAANIKHPK